MHVSADMRNFYPDGTPLSDDDVIRLVAAHTDTIMLAFSRGKDSIAAWLKLKPHFKRIVPYFMWIVPGLRFVEDSLAYFEDVLGTHIIRVPHLQFYKMLREMVYTPPERCLTIEAANLPRWSYDKAQQMACRIAGLPEDTMTAHGITMNDTPRRRAAIMQHGAVNWKRHTFTPVAHLKRAEQIAMIAASGIKLPIDYKWFGSSFDSTEYKYIGPLKEHAPDDYAVVREWFPLVDLEVARYEGLKSV